jgi:anti-sigma B factor antagonist
MHLQSDGLRHRVSGVGQGFSGHCREGRLDINVRKRSQVQVIQLKGQLRLGEAVDELQRTINESLAEGDARFAVNLSEVPMIDSSGIGLLVRFLASAKKRGGSVKLVNLSSFAQKTLRLVGVLNLFEVYEDDDQAVASFN